MRYLWGFYNNQGRWLRYVLVALSLRLSLFRCAYDAKDVIAHCGKTVRDRCLVLGPTDFQLLETYDFLLNVVLVSFFVTGSFIVFLPRR